MMRAVLQAIVIGLGALTVVGTLLSLSKSSHWSVRVWDFPRVQIAVLAAVAGGLYAAFFFGGNPLEWGFLAAVLLCVLWQSRKIYPYTPLAPAQVQRSERVSPSASDSRQRSSFRLLISNVLMENREHGKLLDLIRDSDPDVVIAVETDAAWVQALEPVARTHPYAIRQPQDNYYGLVLFSRLPLVAPRVDFLVQDDIPSVHTGVELPSGDRIFLHGLHPRPPEPLRDQDSTARDAELVVMGKAIRDTEDEPTVVAGDLNDVAWSPTSELFLRLSGLLDPRIGRGFYNSFHAGNPVFRWPLDHVFHSNHFRLVELRRCRNIGSDHFPMLVELSYEPDARRNQPSTPEHAEDEHEAEERVEKEIEAARTGDDRPGRE